jgi:lipoprotein-releasing system ATP-binding protein
MNSILKAVNLARTFEGKPRPVSALKDVNLTVKKGSIVSVLGPSGAGKSTLLHVLGGLDKPDKGQVFLEGVDIYSLNDRELAFLINRKIGFVFQFYHLLGEFTALENVLLPAALYGQRIKHARDRAAELLIRLGLSARMDHKPAELSGGEQQRVAIARSLINRPDLVLCDEPTGNLDSETGREIFDLIMNLRRFDNTTFVIVTHEPRIAEKSDGIFSIKDGILKNK